MNYTIGIDLGATNVRAGVVSEDGEVEKKIKERTSTPDRLGDFIAPLVSEKILAVGLGSPGPLDLEKGIILKETPNLVAFRGVGIVELLKNMFNLPVFLERDTNVALLGEAWKGAAQDKKNVVMLTLGTGVGGAILLDGKLFRGSHAVGAEFGHTIIDKDGPKCRCGNRGDLESYLGLAAVRRDWGLDHWDLIGAVKQKEEKALAITQKLGELLGIELANIVNTFDPELIILGGGLAEELGLPLLEAAKGKMTEEIIAKPPKVEVVISKLGDNAGILGAAKLAFEKLET